MALSAARNTKMMSNGDVLPEILSFKMAATTTIYAGSIVMLDGGYAKPGASAASKIAVGRAEETVVNAGDAGAAEIKVRRGVFKFGNNAAGSDPVVAADVGSACYIEDDFNVCHTATSKTPAGKVIRLDSDGVWVQICLV